MPSSRNSRPRANRNGPAHHAGHRSTGAATPCCLRARAAWGNSRWQGFLRRRRTASGFATIPASECATCKSIARASRSRAADHTGRGGAGRKRGRGNGRAGSADSGDASGCVGHRARPGAAEESGRAAGAARGTTAGRAARGLFQARGATPRHYPRPRRDHALGPCQYFPKDPGGTARDGDLDFADDESLRAAAHDSFAVRAVLFSALQTESVEQILCERTQIAPAERKLAAQLAEGSPGEAVSLDLAEATELRRLILRVLASAAERTLSAIYLRRPRNSPKAKESPLKPYSNCSIVYSRTCWSFPLVAQSRGCAIRSSVRNWPL